jgi:glutamate racemase
MNVRSRLTKVNSDAILFISIELSPDVRLPRFKKMKFLFKATPCIFLLCFSLISCTQKQTFAKEDNLNDFFQKKEVTIAVTDSGLGGLSVMAEAVEKIEDTKMFSRVDFIFFNALFSNSGGYNSLKTQKEKVLIFNSALESLEADFNPDLILIGCNTLSILYDKTPFSQQTVIPVVGIVDSGVELIAESLRSHPEAKVLLFATPTTISEGAHKKKLVERGFLEERIILQACPELAQYIEKNHSGDETEMLIYAYADEALQKLNGTDFPLYISFNCTHYGYSLDLWREVFHDLGTEPMGFLNPNSRMTEFMDLPAHFNRFKSTHVTTRVVSMVEIGEETILSLGRWIAEISPKTAAALQKYEFKENLFEWQKFVTTER